jgi:hypothetical protein
MTSHIVYDLMSVNRRTLRHRADIRTGSNRPLYLYHSTQQQCIDLNVFDRNLQVLTLPFNSSLQLCVLFMIPIQNALLSHASACLSGLTGGIECAHLG